MHNRKTAILRIEWHRRVRRRDNNMSNNLNQQDGDPMTDYTCNNGSSRDSFIKNNRQHHDGDTNDNDDYSTNHCKLAYDHGYDTGFDARMAYASGYNDGHADGQQAMVVSDSKDSDLDWEDNDTDYDC